MFHPGVILVSAGFDAVDGHPPNLGGYKVMRMMIFNEDDDDDNGTRCRLPASLP